MDGGGTSASRGVYDLSPKRSPQLAAPGHAFPSLPQKCHTQVTHCPRRCHAGSPGPGDHSVAGVSLSKSCSETCHVGWSCGQVLSSFVVPAQRGRRESGATRLKCPGGRQFHPPQRKGRSISKEAAQLSPGPTNRPLKTHSQELAVGLRELSVPTLTTGPFTKGGSNPGARGRKDAKTKCSRPVHTQQSIIQP